MNFKTLFILFLALLLGLFLNSSASAASVRKDYATAQRKITEAPDQDMHSPKSSSGENKPEDDLSTGKGDGGRNNSTAFARNLATEAAEAGGGLGSLVFLICLCCCLIGCCNSESDSEVSSEERRPIIIVA